MKLHNREFNNESDKNRFLSIDSKQGFVFPFEKFDFGSIAQDKYHQALMIYQKYLKSLIEFSERKVNITQFSMEEDSKLSNLIFYELQKIIEIKEKELSHISSNTNKINSQMRILESKRKELEDQIKDTDKLNYLKIQIEEYQNDIEKYSKQITSKIIKKIYLRLMKKRDEIEYCIIQSLLSILLNQIEIDEKIVEDNLRNYSQILKKISSYKAKTASIYLIIHLKEKSDYNLQLFNKTLTNNKLSSECDDLRYICLWIQSVIHLEIALHDKDIEDEKKKSPLKMIEFYKKAITKLDNNKIILDFTNNIRKEIGSLFNIKEESSSIKAKIENFSLVSSSKYLNECEHYASNLRKSLESEEAQINQLYQIYLGSYTSLINNIPFQKTISNDKAKSFSFCGCLVSKKRKL